MRFNYTYSCRVWQLDADMLFQDFNFIMLSTHHMIHKSYCFLMLNLHQPRSVYRLVFSFITKLFNHRPQNSSSPLSNHHVPIQERLRVIRKIKDFANSLLADPSNMRHQAIQIGVSFEIKWWGSGPREPMASKSAVEGLEKVQIDGRLIEKTCVICFDRFKHEEEIRGTPCHHLFHGDCISKWLERSNTCPICRSTLPVIS